MYAKYEEVVTYIGMVRPRGGRGVNYSRGRDGICIAGVGGGGISPKRAKRGCVYVV